MSAFRKVCRLCERKIEKVDYKDEHLLSRFISDRGKILPRRATGACARHQRQVATAVKRARYLALLPYIKGYHT
ncbi:MAG: 30S ribosomal protein S18 [Gemmatimonadota bacterium]